MLFPLIHCFIFVSAILFATLNCQYFGIYPLNEDSYIHNSGKCDFIHVVVLWWLATSYKFQTETWAWSSLRYAFSKIYYCYYSCWFCLTRYS